MGAWCVITNFIASKGKFGSLLRYTAVSGGRRWLWISPAARALHNGVHELITAARASGGSVFMEIEHSAFMAKITRNLGRCKAQQRDMEVLGIVTSAQKSKKAAGALSFVLYS